MPMTMKLISSVTASFKDGGKGRSKAQKRLLLWRRQGGKCGICDQPLALADATLDHIVPRSKGGANTYANMRAAHGFCNRARAASMDDIFVVVAGVKALRWNVKELS